MKRRIHRFFKYPAQVSTFNFNTGRWGVIRLYIVKPEHCPAHPHAIFYIHGAGWVFGNFHTHEKLVRELAARTNSVVIFPEYSLSPEAKYPTAIEQCYQVLSSLSHISAWAGLNLNIEKTYGGRR